MFVMPGERSRPRRLLFFIQSGFGAVQRFLDRKIKDYDVSVLDFGADPIGVSDSTTSFQNAINSLPINGGNILVPFGNYKISSTLSIGNGTTSTVSTRMGVVLKGVGNPGTALFNGFTAVSGPKLTWTGGAAPMISIKGPLSGWGVQNLYLDGASTATQGILVTSAQNGDSRNLAIVNALQGIGSTTNPLGGYSGVNNVDSWQNIWSGTTIVVPGASGNFGVVLSGASDATSDTDYNVFDGLTILIGGTNTPISLQIADGNILRDVRIIKSGGTPGNVLLDYSVNAGFPSGNIFDGVDTGISTIGFGNSGSPSTGARPNMIFGLEEQNGAVYPKLSNINVSLPMSVGAGSISQVGQTASIGVNGLGTIYLTGMYRISYYLETVVTGAGGATITATFSWTDDGPTGQSMTSASIVTSTKAFTQGSIVIRAGSGTTPTYNTTVTGTIGTAQYDLFVKVEKMD